jgi:diadenylate cyclase
MMFERLNRLAERLHDYSWWQIAVELLLIWLVVFVVVRFVQGTRAAGALKSTLFLVIVTTFVVRILAQQEQFARIKYLYDTFLTLLAVTMIVVFQPELRRGLIRLGETPIIRRAQTGTSAVIDAIVEASAYLSKARFGGLIVIDRDSGLKGLIEGGTSINGRVSARLLQTIFFPGSALHDLAVIIRGGEVTAAGVQLPLADPEDMPDPSLGSRHRAAVGLSKECNALVVVISEETGGISIAERGRLDRGLTPDRLRDELWRRLKRSATPAAGAALQADPALGETGEHGALGGGVNGDTAMGSEAISEPPARKRRVTSRGRGG